MSLEKTTPRPGRPPTWVTTLPVIVATFVANMVIDSTTDWPILLRWGVALVAGLVTGAITLAVWTRSHARDSDHGTDHEAGHGSDPGRT